MTLKPRQIYFFLALVAPVGKLILLPARLAALSGNDLWLPVLAQLLLQSGLIACVLALAGRERTLPALVRGKLGRVGEIAFSLLLALVLLFCSLLPIVEQKLFVRAIFYDTIPAHLVFTPFFLFSAYLCARPLVTVGRTWDLLAPLAAIGFFGVAVLSVGSTDLGALLPVGASGTEGFWQGMKAACPWFYDALLLLPLVGHFKRERGMCWKGPLFYLLGGGIVLLLLALFYGIFGDIAVLKTFAFAQMSGYFSGMTVLGRVDYLFIFLLAFVATFYAVLPLQGAVGVVGEALRGGKVLLPLLSVGVNVLLFSLVYTLNFHSTTLAETMTGPLFFLPPLSLLVLLFALLPFALGRTS